MNAHKSRARRRRLAHAAGLLRSVYAAPGCPRLSAVRAAWVALRRAGWVNRPEGAFEFLSTRGFNI